jgi:hypothetical protein
VVIERYWYGHNPTYCKLVTEAFLATGAEVILICPDAEEVVRYLDQQQTPNRKQLRSLGVNRFEGPLHGDVRTCQPQVAYWKETTAALARASGDFGDPDLVYFCVCDLLLENPLSLLWHARCFPKAWAGLYLQPFGRLEKAGVRSRRLWLRLGWRLFLRKRCRCLATLDEDCVQEFGRLLGRPVYWFPDVTDESKPASATPLSRSLSDAAGGRTIVGLLGNVAPWKGVGELLEAARKVKRNDFIVAIAGALRGNAAARQATADAIQAVRATGVAVWTHLERIPDGVEYNTLADRCDVLWCVYPGHYHSSNLLTKAALLRKRVIAGAHGIIGDRVRKYELGEVADCQNSEALVKALRRSLDGLGPDSCRARWDDYLASHSRARLQAVIRQIVESVAVTQH